MRAAALAAVAAAAALALPGAFAQDEPVNPTLGLEKESVPYSEFNVVARDAARIGLDSEHSTSWQVTITNALDYGGPLGTAVLRLYDSDEEAKFIEVGMGARPDETFWTAVEIPGEGYIPISLRTERGWSPHTKTVVAYTERAGLTINNGERIVVSNLDVGVFSVGSYSVHGMASYSEPPAAVGGEYSFEVLSGDPAMNAFHLFPFYVTAAVGVLAGVLFLTKRRS